MVRILFLLVVALHALIHFTGFAKGFGLAEITELKQPVTKMGGLLWLLSGLLFLLSVGLLLAKQQWWWMVALVAVLISQVLIFSAWQDARFGTIANVIVLIGCVIGFGRWDFSREAAREVEALKDDETVEQPVTKEQIAALPPVVRQWMERAGVPDQPLIQQAEFEQQGRMKTGPEKDWIPFSSRQYVAPMVPAFVWVADVGGGPFMRFSGLDSYQNGHGRMRIKVLSLLPVVNEAGPEMDQGTLLRFLGESIWFPAAALNERIAWKQLDEHSAEATMTDGATTVSGIFTFSEAGDPVAFEAQRYYLRDDGKKVLEPWQVQLDEGSFRDFDGYRIPTRASVTWKLEEGDYTWLDITVMEAQYNP